MKKNPTIGIISQARTGSTRLPAKIFLPVNGKSLLEFHLSRLSTSTFPIFIATTVSKADDRIEEFCKNAAIPFYRGSEQDVLSRYFECASAYHLDIIVRVTSDCPLIDGATIKKAMDVYLELNDPMVYLSNTFQRTFPRGMDFEIFSMDLLRMAQQEATLESDREHVTPYLWNNRSGSCVVKQYVQKEDYSRFRITVDTAEDFTLIEKLLSEYHLENASADEICATLVKHPELSKINAHIEQKKI